jgi:RecB family exonuclease
MDPPPPLWIDRTLRRLLAGCRDSRLNSFAESPRFRDRLRRLTSQFGEISAASAGQLQKLLGQGGPRNGLEREILEVVHAILSAGAASRSSAGEGNRGWYWPGERIRAAGERLPPGRYWFPGFLELRPPEVQFLREASRRAEIILTMPLAWPGLAECREVLVSEPGCRIEELPCPDSTAAVDEIRIEAATAEEETSEIARRLLELRGQGHPWRDCAVLARPVSGYLPLLQTALDRFGIPAQFDFAQPLAGAAPVRYLAALVEAHLSGGDYDALLELARHEAAPWAETDPPPFVRELQERRPGRGLASFPVIAGTLRCFDSWPSMAEPAEWAERLGGLASGAYSRHRIAPSGWDAVRLWRDRAAALRAWQRAANETAASLDPGPLSFPAFWAEMRECLRLTAFWPPELVEEAVTVTSPLEAGARSWPVVFLPNLLDGELPRRLSSDPILGDATRRELTEFGLPLPSLAQQQEIESALFPFALSRATTCAILSRPRFGHRGEELLPSPVTAHWAAGQIEAASPWRPGRPTPPPRSDPGLGFPPVPPPGDAHRYRPTEIESLLACPFQHYSRYRLKLQPPPPAPSDRFGYLERGSLIHAALRRLTVEPGDPVRAFTEEFEQMVRQKRIPLTHQVEFQRLEILRNLLAYAANPFASTGETTEAEWKFEFDLGGGILISGRIDRFDVTAAGEATAIDYKYSRETNVRGKAASEASVQGGLYLLALESQGYRPVRFAYVPLRGESDAIVEEDATALMATARERTLLAIAKLREEIPAADPADPSQCRTCDFIDVCRIREVREPAAEAASAT